MVGILGRVGGELILDGQPFAAIGVNKFDLLQQFVLPTREHGPGSREAAAHDALELLGAHGFDLIRVNVSPYYPAWFEEVFFDEDPSKERRERQRFFAGFDAMLDACDVQGIRVVATLVWNIENLGDLGHHSLAEGLRDPSSEGRRKVEAFIRAVVGRYRDRPTIAIWEIGNEWNLFADQQALDGPIPGSSYGDAQHPGPVVRDDRNNFTSEDLGRFYRQTATLIRSLDPHHLITTGDSAPRPGDATTEDQLVASLRRTHPDPVDVISVHYYEEAMIAAGGTPGSPENLRLFQRAAEQIGKPLLVGEITVDPSVAGGYAGQEWARSVADTLAVIADAGIPLSLFWTFEDDRVMAQPASTLRYGRTDETLALIERANVTLPVDT
jgi:hypothetical protein